MAPSSKAVYPVRVLGQTATALEAAVLECLEKPRKDAVHRVRTTTRRIEAQLELLELIGRERRAHRNGNGSHARVFPAHREQAEKFRRLLKKLRRAAGEVRDLDVQQNLIDGEAANGAAQPVRKESKDLGRTLKRRRDKRADRLMKLLGRVQTKLPRRVKDLEDALEPAGETVIAEDQLMELVQRWYRHSAAAHTHGVEQGDPDSLHAVRKLAKLARYLAETAPENARRAHKLAERFEALQEAGGQWHDWLILAEIAGQELGGSAELAHRFSQHAEQSLSEFQKRLRYKL